MKSYPGPALAAVAMFVLAALAVAPAGSATAEAPAGKLYGSLAERLAEAAPSDWLRTIVVFRDFDSVDVGLVESLGGRVAYEVAAIPALFVGGTPLTIHRIAALQGVERVVYDEPIEFDLDRAVVTGRAWDLWGVDVPNLTAPDGTRIDGRGVGVAVMDTGVNAMVKDIAHGERVVLNLHALGIPAGGFEPLTWEDSSNTDGNGHGTHVAGIVGGSGALSDGRYRGAAPGAGIYGFGSLVSSFWYAVAGWDWVFQHGASQDPPVRAITNSWGYALGQPCDLNHPLTQVQRRLVLEADVVMLFSAGNAGSNADGSQDTTRTQFKCPWQGNIGVANMNDRSLGRDGPTSGSTSKGKVDDPTTWPDISAPGTQIVSLRGAAAQFAAECLVQQEVDALDPSGCYVAFSGTSMSTPFVAGVVALLLQVRPDLKPADVEYILEQTAYKYGAGEEDVEYHVDPDGDYRTHGSHFVRGHGLVDAEAAVAFALAYDPAEHPVVYGFQEAPEPWFPDLAAGRGNATALDTDGAGLPAPSFLWVVVAGLVAAAAASGVTRRGRDGPIP